MSRPECPARGPTCVGCSECLAAVDAGRALFALECAVGALTDHPRLPGIRVPRQAESRRLARAELARVIQVAGVALERLAELDEAYPAIVVESRPAGPDAAPAEQQPGA